MERGTAIHEHLEQWWKTGVVPNAGEYQPWINSFINSPLIEKWKPLGTEITLVDREHDIAGTPDLILKHVDTGRVALCDYKTKNKEFSKGNHRKQMGGYLSLLQINYPTLHIDTVIIYYITPELVRTDPYDALDCLKQYEQARSAYFAKQLPW